MARPSSLHERYAQTPAAAAGYRRHMRQPARPLISPGILCSPTTQPSQLFINAMLKPKK